MTSYAVSINSDSDNEKKKKTGTNQKTCEYSLHVYQTGLTGMNLFHNILWNRFTFQ